MGAVQRQMRTRFGPGRDKNLSGSTFYSCPTLLVAFGAGVGLREPPRSCHRETLEIGRHSVGGILWLMDPCMSIMVAWIDH